MKDTRTYDLWMVVVTLVGLHEGVAPLVATAFDWHPALALPLRLPTPACWVVSALVTAVCAALLVRLDQTKKRRVRSRG